MGIRQCTTIFLVLIDYHDYLIMRLSFAWQNELLFCYGRRVIYKAFIIVLVTLWLR